MAYRKTSHFKFVVSMSHRPKLPVVHVECGFKWLLLYCLFHESHEIINDQIIAYQIFS